MGSSITFENLVYFFKFDSITNLLKRTEPQTMKLLKKKRYLSLYHSFLPGRASYHITSVRMPS
jgi:hypothetical protein